MNDFLYLSIPLIVGLCVAVSSGALGVFVISQRLAFFSDALAHATLLGISTSLLLALPMNLSFVITGLIFALILSRLLSQTHLSSDTLIGILAHSFLALSLLSISLFSDQDIELEHYLFGDLLHIGIQHLIWVALCLGLTAFFLFNNWQNLILFTLHEDLAKVEGINTHRLRITLTLLLALLVAVNIQLIGALLISALLIIPASTARQWCQSPLTLCISASLCACFSVVAGLAICYMADTPSGPSIVIVASTLFIISLVIRKHSSV